MSGRPFELFGIAVEVVDSLPANSFMMVSRISETPTTFHVLAMNQGGEMKEWRGTLSDAMDATAPLSR